MFNRPEQFMFTAGRNTHDLEVTAGKVWVHRLYFFQYIYKQPLTFRKEAFWVN